MIVYVATKNAGKLRELRALFEPEGWRLLVDSHYTDVDEGVVSYADNARLKASALYASIAARDKPAAVLGDDSGLEVEALDGRPGVLSARYGGDGATWSQRRARLLEELDARPGADRAARFVCALHFIDDGGRAFSSFATVDGAIATEERGELGFSYDALFAYPPLSQTFAEMDEAAKNAVSHRARAAHALLAALRAGNAPGRRE